MLAERSLVGRCTIHKFRTVQFDFCVTCELSGLNIHIWYVQEFPQFPLPEGWVWRTDWRLDRNGAVDPDGWAYAHDFNMLTGWPPTTSCNYEKGSMFVRRRRWIRSRQRKDSTRNLLISLGTLDPHVKVACPIESLRTGGLDYVVQVQIHQQAT